MCVHPSIYRSEHPPIAKENVRIFVDSNRLAEISGISAHLAIWNDFNRISERFGVFESKILEDFCTKIDWPRINMTQGKPNDQIIPLILEIGAMCFSASHKLN